MLNKIIYLILGFSLAFIFFPRASNDSTHQAIVSGASTQAVNQQALSAPELAAAEPLPELTARAALALDFESGTILYSKNLDDRLPIASLTKLMTALVVMEKTSLDDVVTIQKKDQTSIGSIMGLVEGEQIVVADLLSAMLIPSSNDAALALANYISGDLGSFAIEMNDMAKRLGLTDTRFSNPVGWDSDENYSTTRDLVRVVEEFVKYPELLHIVNTRELVVSSIDEKYQHKLTTTNKLLLENPQVQGIKTGFTSKALGNLIIMINHEGRRVLTIVLGSENRETDTRNLISWIYTVYRW